MFTSPDNPRWKRAHGFRRLVAGVARTPSDAETAYQDAIDKDITTRDFFGSQLMGTQMVLSTNEVTLQNIKRKELFGKLQTIIPLVGGLYFVVDLINILNLENPLATVLGLVGTAAVLTLSSLTYREGQAFGIMKDWMVKNNLDKATYFRANYPSSY